MAFWKQVTGDPYIHSVVTGVALNFSFDCPARPTFPYTISCSSAEQEAIVAELNSFLSRGITDKVDHCSGEFIYPIFY